MDAALKRISISEEERIKRNIEKQLVIFADELDRQYSFKKSIPVFYEEIKKFILRKGKRVRPLLFVYAYKAFSQSEPANLYSSAVALEALHDFALIHDDIIDNSSLRSGIPTLNKLFEKHILPESSGEKMGENLAMVAGDIIFAFAMKKYRSVEVDNEKIDRSFNSVTDAAVKTGIGEMKELLYSAEPLENIVLERILEIYDMKTGYYTFCCPMTAGALLADVSDDEALQLNNCGLLMGRAFQIIDDIIDVFGSPCRYGKNLYDDLRKSKKTVLLWNTYNQSSPKNRRVIKEILSKKHLKEGDIKEIKKIIKSTEALESCRLLAEKYKQEAFDMLERIKMKEKYRDLIYTNFEKVLNRV